MQNHRIQRATIEACNAWNETKVDSGEYRARQQNLPRVGIGRI